VLAHLQQPTSNTSRLYGKCAGLPEPKPRVRSRRLKLNAKTYHATSPVPDDPPFTGCAGVKVYFGLLNVRTLKISIQRYQQTTRCNLPNLPGVSASDVRLSILPKGLRVIAGEVEVDGIRP
jgi:hypothetical protein